MITTATVARRHSTAASSTRGLRPAQLARLDQLLAVRIECFPAIEFDDEQQHTAILGPVPTVNESFIPTPPAGTPPYLAALYAFPLLKREQEYHLFRQMHFHLWRAQQIQTRLSEGQPTERLMNRFEGEHAAALAIRNRIVEANLRLVVSIAKNLVDSANTLDDVISEGNVPLVRAVEIFDYRRGLRFSTYATWAIRNALFRSTPRNRRQRARFVSGSELGFFDLQDHRAGDSFVESPLLLGARIREWLSALETRDRRIVEMRFGFNGHPQASKFREIGVRLGISTERVRQLLARALDRLQQFALRDGIETA